MKIAFITHEYITENNFDGGLSNYLYNVSISLKKFGHEPIIFVTSDKNEILSNNGITVIRVDVKKKNKFLNFLFKLTRKLNKPLFKIWQSYQLFKSLKKYNEKNNISIVQYPNSKSLGFFRLKSVPSVIRISSFEPLWNSYRKNKFSKIIEKIELSTIKKFQNIFCPSFFIGEIISRVTNKEVTIIESPNLKEKIICDPSIYNDILIGKRYLLFYGSLQMSKGVDLIAEIIFDLLDSYKDLFFVFIGKDKHYYGRPMIDYVWSKAGKYRERAIYLGKLLRGQLIPIVKNAEAIVLPSRFDNLPNTLIESMTLKKIVVGAEGSSFDQLIRNGINGFLFKNSDYKDLLRILNIVLNLTPEEKANICKNAHKEIQRLDPIVTVGKLVNYYKKIIEL
ncbi:MAG: glycosyltransferase family 4 protein [Nitrososphaeraceae archaeon]